jgi:aspartate/methionine/tyrosine aminotransferase
VALPLWLTKLLVRTRLARFSRRARALTDNDTAALRFYSNRVLAAPHSELLDAALVPHAPPHDAIDLNQPTPDAPPSRGAISVGRTDGLCAPGRVPVVLPELRAALEPRAAGEDLIVTHGATGALGAALDAFVNAGDRVVLFDPCSPLFALGAKSRRARVTWVPTFTEEGRTRFVASDFESAMRGAKLLLLADPTNPTGGTLSDEDREHVARIAARRGVIVYQDESFGAFRDSARPKAMPGLVAGSVSQEFGQPGLRIGWLSGPKSLVRAARLCANVSAPQVSPILQQAAARLMAEAPQSERAARFRAKRNYTLDRLSAMGLEAEAPGSGYFAWVPVGGLGLCGRAFAERVMREEGVFVGAGCAFGPSGTNFVRISFAGDDGRLREGLHRVGAFVARVRNPDAPPVPVSIGEPLEPAPNSDARPAFSRS